MEGAADADFRDGIPDGGGLQQRVVDDGRFYVGVLSEGGSRRDGGQDEHEPRCEMPKFHAALLRHGAEESHRGPVSQLPEKQIRTLH